MKFTRFVVPIALLTVAFVVVMSSSPSSNKGATPAPSQPPDSAERSAPSPDDLGARDQTGESAGGDEGIADDTEGGPYDLSPEHKAGRRARYLVITRSESRSADEEPGDSAPQRSSAFYVVTLETIAHDEDGTELELTYDRIRTRTRTENFNLDTDTELDVNAGIDTIAGSYSRIVGETVKIRLDGTGRIVSIESELSDFGVEPDMFEGARYMLSGGGIRYNFGLLFAHGSARSETRVYEPWTRYYEPYAGPAGDRWVELEHTLLEAKGNTARVSFSGYAQTAQSGADAPDPSIAPETPNIEGVYAWNLADGLLEQAEVTERARNITELPGGGGRVIESVSEIKTTYRRVPPDYTLDSLLAELAEIGRAEGPRPADVENIDAICSRIASRTEQPAMGAALLDSRNILAFGVHGIRNMDTRESIRTDGLFSLGFVTTSMLVTTMGVLVDEGVLSWDMKLPEPLASEVHPAYTDITLEEFMRCRAGVVGFNSSVDDGYEDLPELTGDAPSQRLQAMRAILAQPPAYEPGTQTRTSAASVCAAVVIAEQATGKKWKNLFHEYLLGPLSLRSGRFGWPATSATPDQTRGHTRSSNSPVPVGIGQVPPFDPLRRPATGLALNVQDLAKYASHELSALRGDSELLSDDTAQRLHELEGEEGRVAAWFRDRLANGQMMHWNRSITGGFSTVIILVPKLDIGVVAFSNMGDGSDHVVTLAMEILYREPRMQVRAQSVEPTP